MWVVSYSGDCCGQGKTQPKRPASYAKPFAKAKTSQTTFCGILVWWLMAKHHPLMVTGTVGAKDFHSWQAAFMCPAHCGGSQPADLMIASILSPSLAFPTIKRSGISGHFALCFAPFIAAGGRFALSFSPYVSGGGHFALSCTPTYVSTSASQVTEACSTATPLWHHLLASKDSRALVKGCGAIL